VAVPNSASLGLSTNRLTVACWIYPTNLSGEWSTIIHKSNTNRGWLALQIYARADDAPTAGRPVFRIDWNGNQSNSADEEVQGDIALATNQWYHIACTYDGAAMRFYINGTLRGSTAKANATFPSSTQPIWIGANDIWGEPFRGQIDEVVLYNRALSQEEIQILMGNPPAPLLRKCRERRPVAGAHLTAGGREDLGRLAVLVETAEGRDDGPRLDVDEERAGELTRDAAGAVLQERPLRAHVVALLVGPIDLDDDGREPVEGAVEDVRIDDALRGVGRDGAERGQERLQVRLLLDPEGEGVVASSSGGIATRVASIVTLTEDRAAAAEAARRGRASGRGAVTIQRAMSH
jgi:hypothetical protein